MIKKITGTRPERRNIVQFTTADAERVAGRPLTDHEYRVVVRTLEALWPPDFEAVVLDSLDQAATEQTPQAISSTEP